LLESYYGNKIIYAHKERALKLKVLLKLLISRKLYFIGPGGSSPLGALGFVNAALELKNQIENNALPEPDHIFLANGSMGTAAGLSLGLKIAGLKSNVHAIRVTPRSLCTLEGVINLATKSHDLMTKYDNSIPSVKYDHLIVNDNFYGEIYGKPTKECMEAIHSVKRFEDIQLEPTYTGKAFAALIDFIRKNKKKVANQTILFWNTFNSRDFSDIVAGIDYHELPKSLHWVFEEPIPEYNKT
jgi:D-cysteine desulfhydrase